MKKAFMCSLCHKGLLGGGLYLDSETLTYKTGKLTVDKKLRNLVLPLYDICQVTWTQKVFPVATFRMKNGEEYSIMIFNKTRFLKYFDLFTESRV